MLKRELVLDSLELEVLLKSAVPSLKKRCAGLLGCLVPTLSGRHMGSAWQFRVSSEHLWWGGADFQRILF